MHETDLGEVVRQGAGERADDVIAPVLAQLDILDGDLQHMAGLGAADGDGTGEKVARQLARHDAVDLLQLGRRLEAALGHDLGGAADGLDRHTVAAGDREHRLERGIEIAPVDGLGIGFQEVLGHDGCSRLLL